MRRKQVRHGDITARRKSIAYFPPASRDATSPYQAELNMLKDDMDSSIMPVGSSSEHWPEYKVFVDPPSEEATECLVAALAFEDYEADLASALARFVSRSLAYILHEGEVFLEIVFDSDENPKSFWLTPFPPDDVKIFDGMVTQVIPLEVQQARGLTKAFIELHESDVLHFTFPDSLGGKDGLLRLKAGLEGLGGSLPQFAEGDYDRMRRDFGFSVSVDYHVLRDLALARMTAKLGWHTRSLLRDKVTEFYSFYRYIKFARAMALLREHVVQCLNETCMVALPRIGLSGQISVVGLPTSEELAAKLNELVDGTLSFEEAMKYISVH